jgi:PAS domain S-box-containing protein
LHYVAGLSIGEEIRRRRVRWFVSGLAAATAVFALDTATSEKVVTLIALFAVPPFVAAVGASRMQTLIVAVYSIALTIPSGLIDGIFGDFEHVLKVVVVAVAALAAVRVATVRDRADLSTALDYTVANTLAESATLDEATPRLLERIGDVLGWQAGALWEGAPGGTTLRCVATWQVHRDDLERYEEFRRPLEFVPGVGLPGIVWKSGAPEWVYDFATDERFPRAQAAARAGLHSALAFPVVGDQGVRGVVEFFTTAKRRPDHDLMALTARIGRDIGQQVVRRRAEEAVRQSEALRGAVLESALDCMITMNHEGRIVEFNGAAERTFGYRRAEVAGKLLGEVIVPPSLRQAHARGLERYLSTREARILGKRIELTGIRSDGSEFPLEVAVTRIGTQEPPLFAGYLRDLTEQKRAEQSSQRLAAIVEHSNDAIIAVKPGGEVIAWNPGAERLYGYTAEEAIGRHIGFTVPPQHEDELTELLQRAESGEGVQNHQTERLRKDGMLIDVALTLSPLKDGDGAPIGTAAIIRDITSQKREERRAAFIADAVQVLDGSLDFDVVVRNLVRLIVPRLADFSAIYAPDPDGSIRVLEMRHTLAERAEVHRQLEERYPNRFDDGSQGIPDVLRTGEALLFREVDDEMLAQSIRDEEHLRLLHGLGVRSAMIVPLRARGETFGVITFVSSESERQFDEDDLAFATELARRAALSIDNARLYADLEERRRELEFLARASAELDASLDLGTTLQRVADLTVPYLADGCMVDLIDEHDELRRVASASSFEDVEPVLKRLRSHHIDLEGPHPIAQALRTGHSQHIEHVTDDLRREWSPTDAYLEDIRSWPARGVVVAPMRARGKTLGTIALASFTERPFTQRALATIEELARRAAIAVDNARLYGERSYIAARLQQSLLPPHLPDVPGLEIAARFRPAGEAYDVGGDFYDIFETGTGSWAIAMGDVCGKGADAAALTAMARYTIRATAIRAAQTPERVLSLLNEVLLTEAPREQFLTVAYANLDVREGQAELAIASAGHPLPLLLHADGRLEHVGQPGTLLGVIPQIELHAARLLLGPGDTIVFYTDGVTEARTENGEMFGIEGLRSAVLACVGCDAAEVAERIESSLTDAHIDRPRDDIAIVVVQVSGTGVDVGRLEPAAAVAGGEA